MKSLKSLKEQELSNKNLILIDAMNLFHRQYHVFRQYPYGTAFGFASAIMNFMKKTSSNKFIVCWEGDNNWRKQEQTDYKQTRIDERKKQFTEDEQENFSLALNYTKELLKSIGLIQIKKDDCEADDVIAYLALKNKKDVIIISNDKDFLQLVDDNRNIKILKPAGGGNYDFIGEKEVVANFGVIPKDIPKLLAISGDTSDNVKGVTNFGPVKALKLIKEGKIYRENLKNVFNEEQLAQFRQSYRMVKLGMDKFHHIQINIDDIICSIIDNKELYINMLEGKLIEYDIKKYKYSEFANLRNIGFIRQFISDSENS